MLSGHLRGTVGQGNGNASAPKGAHMIAVHLPLSHRTIRRAG